MPNWCSGRATITGPAPVIAEIVEILNDPEGDLLNWMVPRPKSEDENWYEWNIQHWGCKWPISDIYFENQAEEDSIEFSFCSAWSPPLEAFQTWAESDGRVQYNLEYWEPGAGFVGSSYYDGDNYSESYVDLNQDEAEYKRIASEVWGYEEWEEPEPLTEWYQAGVEAKGLA
jgi:Ferredoxin-like domain in Api92-like protein